MREMSAETIGFRANDRRAERIARELGGRLHVPAVPSYGSEWLDSTVLGVESINFGWRRERHRPLVVCGRRATLDSIDGARSVLCAVKDEEDGPAISLAATLAAHLDLSLIVAHVAPSHAVALPAPPTGFLPSKPSALGEAAMMLRRARRRVGVVGGHDRLVTGKAPLVLLDLVELERAALMVVGSSRKWPVSRLFAGSTGGHVIRRGRCPVLVCPRELGAATRLADAIADAPLPPPG
jgi:nucleotide-binding universal stress UspA family protein